jgi:hypothetical protein
MATPISSFLGFFLVSTTLLVFLSYSKMGFGFEERETSIAITISFIIILMPLNSALTTINYLQPFYQRYLIYHYFEKLHALLIPLKMHVKSRIDWELKTQILIERHH